MKKVKKIIMFVLIAIFIVMIVMFCYVKFMLPNVGAPESLKVESTPERIERGKYLANCVCVCMDCHSTRDWNKFSGPMVEGTKGKGGEEFDQKVGFPGSFYASNITPYFLNDWTDGEILRAITCGVDKKGKALFPVMPYLHIGKMDKEDVYSIIAYLRTLKPVESTIPESKADFPMNIIMNTIPKKAAYSKIPDKTDKVAYGGYLVNAAACTECHTKMDKGKPIEGMDFAGGAEFALATGGVVRSANITPDVETGIGNWKEEDFVSRFKSLADTNYKPNDVEKGSFNTLMPWLMYKDMTVDDLKAIYAYLRTVKPVKNTVKTFE